MKMKKLNVSILIAIIMTMLLIGVVVAGSSADFGYVETTPPIGEVNWLAWFDNSANTHPEGMPIEVVTEDSTNPASGVDQGYQIFGGERSWILQVANMIVGKSHGQPIKMIFGGLGNSSGMLWLYGFEEDEFIWNEYESFTTHGTVALSERTESCPVTSEVRVEGTIKSVTFQGLPNSSYHVYRSTTTSGAGNDASDGRYLYLKTEETNDGGLGTFTDDRDGNSWYIVIRADPETKELLGCHSEEGTPTNVREIDFSATYLPASMQIELAWTTTNETEITGFNLYRSTSEGGVRDKLNAAVIDPKQGGSALGDSYSFIDDDLVMGQEYYYWLEVLQTGDPEEIGPRTALAGWLYYFPLFQN